MSAIAELLAKVPAEPDMRLHIQAAGSVEPQPWFAEVEGRLTFHRAAIARRDALLRVAYEALKELHEAEEAIYPSFEDGAAAQDAWAQRKSLAHFHAEAVLAAIAAPTDHSVQEVQGER